MTGGLPARAQIALPPPLAAPAVRDIILALGADHARFVGGCVRDALLGRRVRDIDLATALPPDAVTRALTPLGLEVIPTGIAHGTVTVPTAAGPVEITTLRHDVETDGRRAVVAFTDDWQADAARRDFTMNALFADLEGRVYDPVDGLADARAGRVRFIGDADARIAEDRLRLLRFFRFHAHYGKGPADEAGLAACRRAAPGLEALSGERVRAELLRLLEAPDPVPVWRLMATAGVLDHLVAGCGAAFAADGGALPGLVRLGAGDPVLRLAAVVVDPGAVGAIAGRLRLSNAEARRLRLLTHETGVRADAAPTAHRRAIDALGHEGWRDAVLLDGARRGLYPAAALAAGTDWQPPAFPIGGRDVAALGIPPGPRTGRLLAEVRAWWVEGDFRADRTACLAELARRANRQPDEEPSS